MSDFTSDFWHWYIAVGTIVSIIGCAVLLKMQTTKGLPKGQKANLHGNVWDGDLAEYNNPLPQWWKWLFYITIVFSLLYLFLYPGLGTFGGKSGWTSKAQYEAEVKAANETYGPMVAKYSGVDIPTLAKDKQATAMGQRLFLNECAPCHGSDAGGAKGFPNLKDKDWLWGGTPEAIEKTLLDGRNGVMPPMGAAVGEAGVAEVAHYVRSLSKLQHDAGLAAKGKEKFAVCAACHGADAKGNPLMGAPNLTDETWLYGSSIETIAETIRNGRNNLMPAQRERLGEAKVHLLAAYVYSLGGGQAPAPAEPAATPAATAK
ncbi:MAG TPA: cytochrome-c oxidase, cbb3-type subunit III [Usitatibacteraceae bacterium]|nr:cytochrome-c oxidase, cbb3-type subunit III [Usitatibacteraceae bacterium]